MLPLFRIEVSPASYVPISGEEVHRFEDWVDQRRWPSRLAHLGDRHVPRPDALSVLPDEEEGVRLMRRDVVFVEGDDLVDLREPHLSAAGTGGRPDLDLSRPLHSALLPPVDGSGMRFAAAGG